MSISSSFRLFPPKLSLTLHPKTPISKTLFSLKPNLSNPSFFSSSTSITIQRFPITTPSSSSSPSPSPTTSSSSLQPIEQLPPNLQKIISIFQSVQEPKAKYQQLLFYGKELTPLDTKFKTKENKVQGCVSQVWVRAYLDSDKNIFFEADSDSMLTKGLAALLVQGLSGRPVVEILQVTPDFVTLLGLQQSLTPSRNNGFLNMLRLMQKKAIEVYQEAEEGGGEGNNGAVEVESTVSGAAEEENERKGGELNENAKAEIGIGELKEKAKVMTGLGSRGERIKEKLERELSPDELEVEDISYQHAGHAGVRGSDGETHFNVRVVSKEFQGKSMVKRHRLIYDVLQEELQSGLHALSIVAKTPAEVS